MKLLLLTPDLGYGGAHLSYAKVATLLAERHEVHCCVFNADREQCYPLPGRVHVLDPARSQDRSRTAAGRFFVRLRALRRLQRALAIDATLSFLEGADYLNFFAGGPGKRFAAIRGSKRFDQQIAGLQGVLRHWLMRRIYPRFDAVLAVSQGLADELETNFGVPRGRLIVTPNFYDLAAVETQRFAPLVSGLAWVFSGRRCLVGLGRLHIQKNFRFLIRTFARLRQSRNDVRLVLIGSGAEEAALVALAEQLGLRVWVARDEALLPDARADLCFLGYQANPLALAAQGQVFVFPSLYEGFPNALVEAMLCGLPVVAADCPHGPREILGVAMDTAVAGATHLSYGVLLPVPDEHADADQAAWCAAISTVLDGDARRMGDLARERALAYTGVEGHVPWLRLCES